MAELLTSLDVVNQSFKKSIRGYDSSEVDEFLDSVSDTLQRYAQRTKELERELFIKNEKLAEYENMKDLLHGALITAQKSADEKVKSAEAEAAEIISQAEKKADGLFRDAAIEAEKLREGVYQIRRVKSLYEKEFRAMLEKFNKMLDAEMSSSQLECAADSILEDYPAGDKTDAAFDGKRKGAEPAYDMPGEEPKEMPDQPNA